MNKTGTIVLVVVVLILVAAGLFAFMRSNSTPAQTGENPTAPTTQTQNTNTGTTGTHTSTSVTTPPKGTTPQKLTIALVSPQSGSIGDSITLHGTGFNSSSVVMLGSGMVQAQHVSADGASLTFVIPAQAGPYCRPGQVCAQYLVKLQPGTYTLTVRNPDGTDSNRQTFILKPL